MTARLTIEGLSVDFGEDHSARVLDDFNLTVEAGEIVAIVGESGSGKSVTARALMRLLPEGGNVSSGSIRLGELDILGASEHEMDSVRGGRLAMLFQEPKRMLDPTATIGSQVAEPLRRHLGLSRKQARDRAIDLLAKVGIPEAARRYESYAHQLSGGMAQRVMIAAALAGEPDVLIADEPTTALDVTIEVQILRLIALTRSRLGMSVILISHDLGVVASVADRVVVLYAGRVVEEGPTSKILSDPQHPYSQALIRCSLLQAESDGRLFSIRGGVTEARTLKQGCRFSPRCRTAVERNIADQCVNVEPDLSSVGQGHSCRCWATIPVGRGV